MKAIKVYGTSCLPFIKSGDVVFYKREGKIKKGDFVVYFFGGKKYIHRVLKVEDDFLLIANDDDIEIHKVSRKDIYGKVIMRGRIFNFAAGKILSFLRRFKRWVFSQG